MDTASPSVNSRGLLRLAAVIAAIPLGMLLLAALLILSPPYQRYTDEDWITGAHDLYTASNRQCDILIYGDSTAMVGIPAARLSIVYGHHSVQRLLALTGISNAKRILYSAERYSAEQAISM